MKKKKPTARAGRKRSYQVFISHATADKWLATMICERLEHAGAETFRDDRDINGGDDIPDHLRREIIRSREMVVLVTPESVNRPWVLLEIGGAWLRKMRITPILCHVSIDRIPEIVKSKKAVHLNDLEAYVESIRQRLELR